MATLDRRETTPLRILVLVLGAHSWPYPLLSWTIGRTWASVTVPAVEVLVYTGGPKLRRRGQRLQLAVSDAYEDIDLKTMAAFEHVLLHEEFDLLFRTNLSSYVDLANLQAYAAQHARRERFYAGVIGMHEGVPFASGSGFFLSRELVARVIERREDWDRSLPDDVGLAKLLRQDRIAPEDTPRVEYRDSREIVDVDTSHYHFRCKTRSGLRIDDVESMLAIHEAFLHARGERLPLRLVLAQGIIRGARPVVRRLRRRG